MEAALDAFAHRISGDPAPEPVRRFPFDTTRRRESAIVGDHLYVKGAPEVILSLSTDGTEPPAWEALRTMTSRGLRVLAVAERPMPSTAGDPVPGEAVDYET
jgi:magnesium-transporting ATPase (P-type)